MGTCTRKKQSAGFCGLNILMGWGRDLNTAYNQERVAKGLQESSEASGSWRKVAKANRWYERAEAYDARLAEQATTK